MASPFPSTGSISPRIIALREHPPGAFQRDIDVWAEGHAVFRVAEDPVLSGAGVTEPAAGLAIRSGGAGVGIHAAEVDHVTRGPAIDVEREEPGGRGVGDVAAFNGELDRGAPLVHRRRLEDAGVVRLSLALCIGEPQTVRVDDHARVAHGRRRKGCESRASVLNDLSRPEHTKPVPIATPSLRRLSSRTFVRLAVIVARSRPRTDTPRTVNLDGAVIDVERGRDASRRHDRDAERPEDPGLIVRRIVADRHALHAILRGRAGAVVGKEHDGVLGRDRHLAPRAAAQRRRGTVNGVAFANDPAQRRIEPRWRNRHRVRDEKILHDGGRHVVAEDRGARRVLDVEGGDLVAVCQRNRIAGSGRVRQPRRGDAPRHRAAQLLAILEADAAVENGAAARPGQDDDLGSRTGASLDIGERRAADDLRAGRSRRRARLHEPAHLIGVRLAVDTGLRRRDGRPAHRRDTDRTEPKPLMRHAWRNSLASYVAVAAQVNGDRPWQHAPILIEHIERLRGH